MVFISHSKVVISISIDIITTTWTFLDSTCLLSTESETPPTLWVEPNGMCFNKFSRWFPCMLKFCKHSWKYAKILCNRIQLFTTPWTVAHQALLFMEFSGQEYWSGLPFPSQGIFLTQRSNPGLLHCRQILYHLSHQRSSSLSSRRKSNSMEERIFFSSWKFPIYSMSKFQKHFAYQHSPTTLSVFLAQIIRDLLWIPYSYLQYHLHDQWILLSKILFSCHQILLLSI